MHGLRGYLIKKIRGILFSGVQEQKKEVTFKKEKMIQLRWNLLNHHNIFIEIEVVVLIL